MGRPYLELDHLRAFLAVVDSGGFTAACGSVGRTQSAVSLKIRKLESILGKAVFIRNAHRIVLTPTGEMLLGYARRLVQESDEVLDRLLETETSEPVRLGLAELVAPDHLPRVLTRFRRAYPRVTLDVQIGLAADLLKGLRRGALDLVIANREGDEWDGRAICAAPLHWVAAGDYELPATGPVPLVTFPSQCSYRQLAIAALQTVGRASKVVCTCTSLAGVEAAVQAGLGLAVLGRSSLRGGRQPMRDVGRGLPPLPDCEIAIFGERAMRGSATPALATIIEESFHGTELAAGNVVRSWGQRRGSPRRSTDPTPAWLAQVYQRSGLACEGE